VNPQLEWTGGGVASTSEDLARWARLLYTGRVIDTSLVRQMVDGVPARLGPNVRYGLGAIVRRRGWARVGAQRLLPRLRHRMLYFPRSVAVAIEVNATDPYPRGWWPSCCAPQRSPPPRSRQRLRRGGPQGLALGWTHHRTPSIPSRVSPGNRSRHPCPSFA
jgi:hypothetical protein